MFIFLLSKRYKYVYYLETSLIYYLSKNELKIEPIYLHMELLDIFITLPNKFKSIYVIVSGNKINIDNYVLDKRDYIMNETIESLIYKGYSIKPSIVIKLDYMVSDIKDIDEKYIKLLIIKNKIQNYYKYYLTNNRILNNRYYVNLIDCLIKKIEEMNNNSLNDLFKSLENINKFLKVRKCYDQTELTNPHLTLDEAEELLTRKFEPKISYYNITSSFGVLSSNYFLYDNDALENSMNKDNIISTILVFESIDTQKLANKADNITCKSSLVDYNIINMIKEFL